MLQYSIKPPPNQSEYSRRIFAANYSPIKLVLAYGTEHACATALRLECEFAANIRCDFRELCRQRIYSRRTISPRELVKSKWRRHWAADRVGPEISNPLWFLWQWLQNIRKKDKIWDEIGREIVENGMKVVIIILCRYLCLTKVCKVFWQDEYAIINK
jgi:hypothetical protein